MVRTLLLLLVVMTVLAVTWADPDPAPVDENVVRSYGVGENVVLGYTAGENVAHTLGENVAVGYDLP